MTPQLGRSTYWGPRGPQPKYANADDNISVGFVTESPETLIDLSNASNSCIPTM